jgi:hypothetical protein
MLADDLYSFTKTVIQKFAWREKPSLLWMHKTTTMLFQSLRGVLIQERPLWVGFAFALPRVPPVSTIPQPLWLTRKIAATELLCVNLFGRQHRVAVDRDGVLDPLRVPPGKCDHHRNIPGLCHSEYQLVAAL